LPQTGDFAFERRGGGALRVLARLDDRFPVRLLRLALRLLLYRARGRCFDPQPLDLRLDLGFCLRARAGDFIG
jgi:hypothetical protein